VSVGRISSLGSSWDWSVAVVATLSSLTTSPSKSTPESRWSCGGTSAAQPLSCRDDRSKSPSTGRNFNLFKRQRVHPKVFSVGESSAHAAGAFTASFLGEFVCSHQGAVSLSRLRALAPRQHCTPFAKTDSRRSTAARRWGPYLTACELNLN